LSKIVTLIVVGELDQDIHRLEAEIARLRQRVADSDRLLGIVAHDLRNPLTAITTAAEIVLRKGGADEHITRMMRRILESGDRMTRIVSQLTDLARFTAEGKLSIDPRPCDLTQLVARVAGETRLAHADAEVRLSTVGDGVGHWDEARLGAVLANVIGNAIQHGEPAPVEVRVEGETGRVRVVVHNRGAPIDPGLLPHVFEAFRHAGAASTRPRQGLGLGLFVARHAVEAHGGSIAIASPDGDGTTVTVELPRSSLSQAAEHDADDDQRHAGQAQGDVGVGAEGAVPRR
jgi:phosphoserine phosphatase RsbU/P